MASILELRQHFDRLIDLPLRERTEQLAALPESVRVPLAELLGFDEDAVDATHAVADQVLSAVVDDAMPETLGPFRVIRELGRGGMGTVYEAEQDSPRRRVALKVAHPWLPEAVRVQLPDEAQAMVELLHPGIPQVYELLEVDGRTVIAMEFVRGEALSTASAPLDLRRRVDLLARVAEAVGHAHERGIVHRDLKPGNILVAEGGQPKVLDFGIATVGGRGVGPDGAHTPAYAAPEQAIGEAGDARSDVYALGMLGEELLTGSLPTEGQPASTALPRDLAAVLAKARQPAPALRYGDARELARDLDAWRRARPVAALRGRAGATLRPLVRRFGRPAAVVAAVAAVTALAGLGLYQWRAAMADVRREAAADELIQHALADVPVTISERTDALLQLESEASVRQTAALSRAWLDTFHGEGAPSSWLERSRRPIRIDERRRQAVAHALLHAPHGEALNDARIAAASVAAADGDWPGLRATLGRVRPGHAPELARWADIAGGELTSLSPSMARAWSRLSLERALPGAITAVDAHPGMLISTKQGVVHLDQGGTALRARDIPGHPILMTDEHLLVTGGALGRLHRWPLSADEAPRVLDVRRGNCHSRAIDDADLDGVGELYCGQLQRAGGLWVAEPPDSPLREVDPDLIQSGLRSSVGVADLVADVPGKELLVAARGSDLRLYGGVPDSPELLDRVVGDVRFAAPIRTPSGVAVLASFSEHLSLFPVEDGRFGEARLVSAFPVQGQIAVADLDGDGVDEVVTGALWGSTTWVAHVTASGPFEWFPLPISGFDGTLVDADDDGLPDLVAGLKHDSRVFGVADGTPRAVSTQVLRLAEPPPTDDARARRTAARIHELLEAGMDDSVLELAASLPAEALPTAVGDWLLTTTTPGRRHEGQSRRGHQFRAEILVELRRRLAVVLLERGDGAPDEVQRLLAVTNRMTPAERPSAVFDFRRGVAAGWHLDDPAAVAFDPLAPATLLHLDPTRPALLRLPVRYDGGPIFVDLRLHSSKAERDAGPRIRLSLGDWTLLARQRLINLQGGGAGSLDCKTLGERSRPATRWQTPTGSPRLLHLESDLGVHSCRSETDGRTWASSSPPVGSIGEVVIEAGYGGYALVRLQEIEVGGLKILPTSSDRPTVRAAIGGDVDALEQVAQEASALGAVAASQLGEPLEPYLDALTDTDRALLLRRQPQTWAPLLRGSVDDAQFADIVASIFRMRSGDPVVEDLLLSPALSGLPMDTRAQRAVNLERARLLIGAGRVVEARRMIATLRASHSDEAASLLQARMQLKLGEVGAAQATLRELMATTDAPTRTRARIHADEELRTIGPEGPRSWWSLVPEDQRTPGPRR